MQQETVQSWLDSLAAKQPTPGGGGAAALLAAMSAALLGMVSIYTTGPKWQAQEKRMQELNSELAKLRQQALELVDSDAEAFAAVGAAYKLPKSDESEKAARTSAIQAALLLAAEPPQQTAVLASRLVEMAEEIAENGNANVISDVAVASLAAEAALGAAIVNIEINQGFINDENSKQYLSRAITAAEQSMMRASAVTSKVRTRIGQG